MPPYVLWRICLTWETFAKQRALCGLTMQARPSGPWTMRLCLIAQRYAMATDLHRHVSLNLHKFPSASRFGILSSASQSTVKAITCSS